MSPVHPGLTPGKIGGLELRNRLLKAATYEGMSPGGHSSDALKDFHAGIAAGGAALTTVAYAAVEEAGRTFADQLLLDPTRGVGLRELTDAVHSQGAAASIQLAHAGGFSGLRGPSGRLPGGPSTGWNTYGFSSGLFRVRKMSVADIETTVAAFGRAGRTAREAGFDAVELHLGHGYLLSQFLSPALNRRTDAYGGSTEARLRAPLEVLRALRAELGPDIPILAKTNLCDGFPGGLQLEESIVIHQALEQAGVDAIVMSGGVVSKTPFYLLRGDTPVAAMARAESRRLQKLALRLFAPFVLKAWPFEEMFFRHEALEVRKAVRLPLVLLGGVVSSDNIRQAMDDGFDFVALGRALIADPDLPSRVASGEDVRSRCTHCNLCIAEMDRSGVRCVL